MFAYVIMSYERPDLALRLARRIRELSPHAVVVVRHDARRGRFAWPALDGVEFGEHTAPLHWGHWTMVAAMLAELEIIERRPDVTHVVFVSERDYPLRRLDQWERSVSAYGAVMTRERLEFQPRWGRRRGYVGTEDAIRHRYRWFGVPLTGGERVRRSKAFGFAVRCAARVTSHVRPLMYVRVLPRGRGLLIGVRRRWPAGPVYKGWPWIMLSAEGARLALDDLRHEIWRRTLIPEESYFQTLVSAAGLPVLEADISFTRWNTAAGTAHPWTLGVDELEEAFASGSPFARKFDDTRVLDLIDERVDASR